MQPQGHASSSQHAHGVEILPFVQAQLDLEAAKRREYKRVNTALREQDAAKKKARTETQVISDLENFGFCRQLENC